MKRVEQKISWIKASQLPHLVTVFWKGVEQKIRWINVSQLPQSFRSFFIFIVLYNASFEIVCYSFVIIIYMSDQSNAVNSIKTIDQFLFQSLIIISFSCIYLYCLIGQNSLENFDNCGKFPPQNVYPPHLCFVQLVKDNSFVLPYEWW